MPRGQNRNRRQNQKNRRTQRRPRNRSYGPNSVLTYVEPGKVYLTSTSNSVYKLPADTPKFRPYRIDRIIVWAVAQAQAGAGTLVDCAILQVKIYDPIESQNKTDHVPIATSGPRIVGLVPVRFVLINPNRVFIQSRTTYRDGANWGLSCECFDKGIPSGVCLTYEIVIQLRQEEEGDACPTLRSPELCDSFEKLSLRELA